jgi:hypothetical protein
VKFDKTTPCSECPFRKKALPGWLGGGGPEDFVGDTMNDALMPCHTDKNFIKARDTEHTAEEWTESLVSGNIQHCAGARIFFKNQCKVSVNPIYSEALRDGKVKPVEKNADVFSWRHEFIAHHSKKLKDIK